MPYNLQVRNGQGAFGVVVDTAADALCKLTELMDDGHLDVGVRNLLGAKISVEHLQELATGEQLKLHSP